MGMLIRAYTCHLFTRVTLTSYGVGLTGSHMAVSEQVYLSLFAYTLANFGPSGVRALPLAAGINVGGHYKWHFFLFFLLLPAHC